MKFLRIGSAHAKNERGFELLAKEANAELDIVSSIDHIQYETYELVWIPQGLYHSLQLPNAKQILYGPHNFVFPSEPWTYTILPDFKRSIYTCLSEYIKKIWVQFPTITIPVKALPFPVDIERFKPDNSEKELDCFVYFKSRSREDLQYVENILQCLKYKYTVIYCGKYKEEDYISILQKSKFGIWLGAHESQGFALQEALSMDVPLIVCNVKSLHDEINGEGNHSYIEYKDKYDLAATSCPYWDARCGIVIYDLKELNTSLESIKNTYTPRNYILETLSPKACYDRLIESFKEL